MSGERESINTTDLNFQQDILESNSNDYSFDFLIPSLDLSSNNTAIFSEPTQDSTIVTEFFPNFLNYCLSKFFKIKF